MVLVIISNINIVMIIISANHQVKLRTVKDYSAERALHFHWFRLVSSTPVGVVGTQRSLKLKTKIQNTEQFLLSNGALPMLNWGGFGCLSFRSNLRSHVNNLRQNMFLIRLNHQGQKTNSLFLSCN